MTAAVVVVMERGSEWPAHIEDLTNVVGLSPDGDDLLLRTEERLRALERRGQAVRVAVLACNAATEPAALVHRATLAHALVGTVGHAVHGRVILSAKEGASATVRRDLFSLAGRLTETLRGTSASVHLWLGSRLAGVELGRGATRCRFTCVSSDDRSLRLR